MRLVILFLTMILAYIPQAIANHCGKAPPPDYKPANVGEYYESLDSPDVKTVLSSIQTICYNRQKSAALKLYKLFDHADPDVRAKAAQALGVMKIWVPGLEKLLSDDYEKVRAEAVFALEQIGNSDSLDALLKYKSGKYVSKRLLNKMDPSVIANAYDDLIHRNYLKRDRAWLIVQKKKDPKTVAILIEKIGGGNLSDEEPYDSYIFRRDLAAEVIGQYKDEDSIKKVLTAIKSKTFKNKKYLFQALQYMKAKSAAPVLIEILKNGKPDLKNLALITIIEIQARSAIPALLKIAAEDNTELKYQAIYALGKFKVKAAVPLLIKLAKNTGFRKKIDNYVKYTAISALGDIGSKKAVPHLIQLYEEFKWPSTYQEHSFNGVILRSLGKIKDKKTVPTLLRIYEAKLKKYDALPKKKWPSKKNKYFREALLASAKALCVIGDQKATLPLLKMLKYKHLRHRAVTCISLLKDPRTIPHFQELMYEKGSPKREIINALSKIDDERVTLVFVKALYITERRGARLPAIYFLAKKQDPKALPHLVAAAAYYRRTPRLRDPIARIVCESGDKASIRELVKKLHDPHICRKGNLQWTLDRFSRNELPEEKLGWYVLVYYWSHISNPHKKITEEMNPFPYR